MSDAQTIYHADDATLAHIARLEVENAELKETLRYERDRHLEKIQSHIERAEKAKAENTELRWQLEQAKRDEDAIRTLMNCYNVGGWTDSISVLQRAEKAEAELRAFAAALREAGKG